MDRTTRTNLSQYYPHEGMMDPEDLTPDETHSQKPFLILNYDPWYKYGQGVPSGEGLAPGTTGKLRIQPSQTSLDCFPGNSFW